MAKQLMFSQEARQQILKGISKLADAVRTTMGPAGHNVIMQKAFGAPRVTKDGVSVSKEIELPQPFENMGAKLVNQVASKTSDVVGDGTTAATILAEAIFREGSKLVLAGANPMAVKRGIDIAVRAAVEGIKQLSIKVRSNDDLAKVATISANGDVAVGKLLASALEEVGADGVIEVEEGKSLETEKEVVEGMQFDKGFLSPYFLTDPGALECVLEDPAVLVYEKKISSLRDLIPLLETITSGGRSLLVIAEAMLGDIAVITGATMISEDLGLDLSKITLKETGSAKKVVVDKDSTTIIQGTGKKTDVKGRIEQIRAQIEKTTSDYDREKLQERLARLTGGVAVIRVGGATEIEVKERKDLVEDAFHATKAAAEEGIVPGGGVAFLRAIPAVERARDKARGDEKIGVDIILKSLRTPTRQIACNSGKEGDVVVEQILEKTGHYGFDARNGEFVDMVKAGIVDPAKVSRVALENAASIAGLMLTTEVLVTELKDEEKRIEHAVR